MEFERGGFEILFKEIDYNKVKSDLLGTTDHCYCYINKDLFVNSAFRRFCGYNLEEIENIYLYLKQKGTTKGNDFSIFHLIQSVSEELLKWDDKSQEPYCDLKNVLKWREVSLQLGQDFFTCAIASKKSSSKYNWSPIVSVKDPDNNLDNLFKSGLAENHFHLGGSTRLFELNWISIMNYVLGRDKEFDMFSNKLQNQISFSIDGEIIESLKTKCRMAALFRIYLYAIIEGYNEIKAEAEVIIQNVVSKNGNIEFFLSKIQDLIEQCNIRSMSIGIEILDYSNSVHSKEGLKAFLIGERYFLTNCYKKSCDNIVSEFSDFEKNIFYKYLIIKTQFRSEFIQVNRQIGFSNFQNYQNRKKYFVKKHDKYKRLFDPLAISTSIENQNIIKFEARICPEDSAKELRIEINNFISNINEMKKGNLKLKNTDFYLVLHFPKSPDTEYVLGEPRNHKIRKQTNHHMQIIENVISMYPDLRRYVRGIDACSTEIGCRPEVFAECYRELLGVRCTTTSIGGMKEDFFLRATYHVGEDFLDIIDGLRAIDEAILFCGLEEKARLGHALALGIDAKSYYLVKNMTLALQKQILLDNLVWIIKKSEEYSINEIKVIGETLFPNLKIMVGKLMLDIYGIEEDEKKIEENIQTYFESWHLRGDNPGAYFVESNVVKCFEKKEVNPKYKYYFNPAIDGIKSKRSNSYIRENRECINFYHRYHFDKNVRDNGNVITYFKIEKSYIYLVSLLQDEIIKYIEEKNIYIETNPSSNYLISSIARYDQHPIIRFNNYKLIPSVNRNKVNVSINTDDQGVFDTLLENEYALVYESINKAENEDGSKKYHNVLEWMEEIRKNGLRQTFD